MDKDKRHKAKEASAATDERTGPGVCRVIVAGIGASEGGLSSLQQLFAGASFGADADRATGRYGGSP